MKNNTLILIVAVIAALFLLVMRKPAAAAAIGQFTPASIYNPNGGDGSLWNYDKSLLNGGYTGTMGNVSDGNAYSMGL